MKSPLKRLSNVFSFVYDSSPGSRRQRKQDQPLDGAINNLLAYYGNSPAADTHRNPTKQRPKTPESLRRQRQRPSTRRKLSGASTSSSDYSEDSDSIDEPFSISEHDAESTLTSDTTTSSKSPKKRSAVPSKGGADRRRLAIVQMETLQDAMNTSGTNSTASSIRSRRGLATNLEGLALVAPPDASTKSYAHLTPPSTAPLKSSTVQDHHLHQRSSSAHGDPETESMNKARHTNNNKTGGLQSSTSYSSLTRYSDSTIRSPAESTRAMLSPVTYASPTSAFGSASSTTAFITTPNIGESKPIDVPVAAPVVIDLSRNAMQRNTNKSSTALAAHRESPSAASTATLSPFDPALTSNFKRYTPGMFSPLTLSYGWTDTACRR